MKKGGWFTLGGLAILGGGAAALAFVFGRAKSAYQQATRSPQDILDAVAAEDPESTSDLQPGYEGATHCNLFVYRVLRRLGIDLPWGEYGTRANNIIAYMDAGNDGWFPATADDAQAYAMNGKVAVATYYNINPPPHDSGHVAIVLPIPGSIQIAQAGNSNFAQGDIRRGFGNIRPQFYVHD